ncbi:MAG: uracil-DNA glycosylase [Nitrospirae bacterium]|nr:uracil-DNA glycosylase [Nitrospirota bacterium]
MSNELIVKKKEIKATEKIVENIKSILEFYGALGFEMLPIKCLSLVKTNDQSDKLFDKGSLLKYLRKEIGDCNRCRLSKGRTNIVFGEGNPDARLMFIGEAPGREEDLQGRPFVGDAGRLLTRLIEKMGYKRKDVYIANIVKCRPPMNRDPEKDEIEICKVFVEKQIEIIKPVVIISLGRISAQTLIGNDRLKMTSIRGNFFDYKGIHLMPTFHPAYLLRNPKDKWLTWSDAQKVLERLKGIKG